MMRSTACPDSSDELKRRDSSIAPALRDNRMCRALSWQSETPLDQYTFHGLRACMLAYAFYDTDSRIIRYAEALVDAGAKVDAIVLGREGQEREQTIRGVHIHRIWRRRRNETGRFSYLFRLIGFFLRSMGAIARLHLRHRYDLVHIHSVPDFEVFAAVIPKLLGAKLILDIHDIVPEFYAAKFGVNANSTAFQALLFIERISAAFAHHVIASNDLWLEKLAARSVATAKCTVLINFPETCVFHPNLRNRSADGKFVLIYPGTLNWHQGVDVALRAVAIAAKQLPSLELHIYGEGSEKANLIRMVDELNLGDRVLLKPPLPREQIAVIMANADAGVVPKRNDAFGGEAFSTKILEFMALGVPVLAAETRIDRYYFDSSLVRFFQPDDPASLAVAILDAHAHPMELEAQTSNALAFATAHSWKRRRNDYLRLVAKLVQSN
jgi:glycosyltransferase involved in cell wall biosynthesis